MFTNPSQPVTMFWQSSQTSTIDRQGANLSRSALETMQSSSVKLVICTLPFMKCPLLDCCYSRTPSPNVCIRGMKTTLVWKPRAILHWIIMLRCEPQSAGAVIDELLQCNFTSHVTFHTPKVHFNIPDTITDIQ